MRAPSHGMVCSQRPRMASRSARACAHARMHACTHALATRLRVQQSRLLDIVSGNGLRVAACCCVRRAPPRWHRDEEQEREQRISGSRRRPRLCVWGGGGGSGWGRPGARARRSPCFLSLSHPPSQGHRRCLLAAAIRLLGIGSSVISTEPSLEPGISPAQRLSPRAQ